LPCIDLNIAFRRAQCRVLCTSRHTKWGRSIDVPSAPLYSLLMAYLQHCHVCCLVPSDHTSSPCYVAKQQPRLFCHIQTAWLCLHTQQEWLHRHCTPSLSKQYYTAQGAACRMNARDSHNCVEVLVHSMYH